MKAPRLPIGFALAAWLAGCTSATVLRSNPSGATVKRYGVVLGTTPLTFADTQVVLTSTPLTLEREGYEPTTILIQRDQWNVAYVVLSCIFCPPALLWSAEYRPEYVVQMTPAGATAPTPGYPPPAYPPQPTPPPR